MNARTKAIIGGAALALLPVSLSAPAHAAQPTTEYTCLLGNPTTVRLKASWTSNDKDISRVDVLNPSTGARLLTFRPGRADKLANSIDATYSFIGSYTSLEIVTFQGATFRTSSTITCT